ncbi:molybdopterin-dependent oxidoreductase [Rhizobium halophytocola]|uniref:Oxidoreductase molybdopterin-binding domain-containing protein n=1 Tax=Rhizobium halophytocola TaxID=735519 RepID=A0ABS4E0B6_9HYPH|nr:molybdopterin-dependent oxidoreductase [Rhizobium halophytocola]MBP1851344.1 hypothetical protein [Rhizobium halophytocola]
MKKLFALTLMLVSSGAPAGALDMPAGEPILIVSGAVAQPNRGSEAVFDRTMLEDLPGREAKMETPWTEGVVTFSGPYLRSVLQAAGAKGSRLIIHALNDYAAEVPFSDSTTLDTILAVRLDGEEMSVREKGPSWLIYPFDLDHSLYSERYFSRSVWQIKSIEVLD